MDNVLIYECIHTKLCEKMGLRRYMSKRDLYKYLGIHFKIPKKMVPCIIKEMELVGILKDLDKRKVEILPVKLDLEQNANKIYAELGIF